MNKYNDFFNIVTQEEKDSLTLAYELGLKNLSKKDIFKILSETNDDIKPIAIISINGVETKKEADIILSHLTGQDGRIREAVSSILADNTVPVEFLLDDYALNILVKGILDINPNVSRNMVFLIQKNEILKNAIEPFLISKTKEILKELSILGAKNSKNDLKSEKNHKKNKLTFNLYWLLSSLINLKNEENLEEILTQTANFQDYTIREKTASILSKMKNPPKELLIKLKNDENIYVKNQLL